MFMREGESFISADFPVFSLPNWKSSSRGTSWESSYKLDSNSLGRKRPHPPLKRLVLTAVQEIARLISLFRETHSYMWNNPQYEDRTRKRKEYLTYSFIKDFLWITSHEFHEVPQNIAASKTEPSIVNGNANTYRQQISVSIQDGHSNR